MSSGVHDSNYRIGKKEFLQYLGLQGTDNLFKQIGLVKLHIQNIELYENIFNNLKFKRQIYKNITRTIENKQPTKKLQILSLADIFADLSEFLMSKQEDLFFVDAFKKKNIESLVKLCVFVEKCLEDVYEKTISYVGQNKGGTDFILNDFYDQKLLKACSNKNMNKIKWVLVRVNPAQNLMKNIMKMIKSQFYNISSVTCLNLIRKYVRQVQRITRNKQTFNFAFYKTLFDNDFIIGNPNKDFIEGKWSTLIIKLLSDLSILLEGSHFYFVLEQTFEQNYQFTIDPNQLNFQVEQDFLSFKQDLEIIKQKALYGTNKINDQLNSGHSSVQKKIKTLDDNLIYEWIQRRKQGDYSGPTLNDILQNKNEI